MAIDQCDAFDGQAELTGVRDGREGQARPSQDECSRLGQVERNPDPASFDRHLGSANAGAIDVKPKIGFCVRQIARRDAIDGYVLRSPCSKYPHDRGCLAPAKIIALILLQGVEAGGVSGKRVGTQSDIARLQDIAPCPA